MIAVNFQIELGEFRLAAEFKAPGRGVTALYGHSGSGKTTLLRCIAGLQSATGTLSINGQDWQNDNQNLATHQRPLAYVFQEPSLFPHLSVQGNLDYGFKRTPVKQRQISMAQAIQWLGLEPLLTRRPDKLSGGERQRVAIARALLTSPRLLLMDEPLAALDRQSRNEIMPYLELLRDSLSIPILYVTHSPDEVMRLADHIVVLEKGQILAAGPLTETLARLDLPMGEAQDAGVVISAEVTNIDKQWHLAQAQFDGGELWVRDSDAGIGSQIRLRVLARDVSLSLQRHDDSSILNALQGKVIALEQSSHPAVQLVKIRVGNTDFLAWLTALSIAKLGIEPEQQVWVLVKSAAVIN